MPLDPVTGIALGSLISSIVGGLVNVFTTKSNQNYNTDQWQKQNEYNENLTQDMWNKYNSPSAQMKALTDAGMSQSAAGSMLSNNAGVSYMVGTPIQGNNNFSMDNIGDLFSKALGNIGSAKDIKGKDIDNQLKILDKKLRGLSIQQMRHNVVKAEYDAETSKNNSYQSRFNAYLTRQELDNAVEMASSIVKLNKIEVMQAVNTLVKTRQEVLSAALANDVKQYESLLAQFKSDFLQQMGFPVDFVDNASNIVGVIRSVVTAIGGNTLSHDYSLWNLDDEKEFMKFLESLKDNNTVDNSNVDVHGYPPFPDK